MKSTLFGSLVLIMTASFVLGTPRSIGGVATLDIPDSWSFLNSGDAFTFVAENPTETVSIRIASTLPNNQPDIAARNVDGVRALLDMALSKIELEYIYDTVAMGYVPISMGESTGSFGASPSGDSYGAWRSNTYNIYWEDGVHSGTFEVQLSMKAIFDGNRIYLIRYWASEFATSAEQTQGLNILNNGFRSTKVGNPTADQDGDYLSNQLEVLILRSNPLSRDSNNDGISDDEAYEAGLNPNDDASKLIELFGQKPTMLGLLAPEIYVPSKPIRMLIKKTASYSVDDNFRATSFAAAKLPPGLRINLKTGQISGTPTKRGLYRSTLFAQGKVSGQTVTRKAVVRFLVE